MGNEPKGTSGDTDLLKQIREFTDRAIQGDNGNRQAAVADLQFLAGEQWPADIQMQRKREGRPCLTFNRLPTYLHQVTNDQRQSQAGIRVHPVGSGADKKGAELYQGMIRRIEDVSNADTAYDTAVNSAAAIGFGFWRLITEYESPTSFNQAIKFQRMRDALKVYFDPASVEADGSDAKQCVVVSDMARAEFERAYPNKIGAIQTSIGTLGGQVQAGWMSETMVRVVEYYYFAHKAATLYLLADGTTTTNEPPAGAVVQATRQTQIPQLKWVKACAGAVLERTDIMCRWIPVFPVWGDEIDIQGKVIRKGIIRDAKDPAQMYNFWMTSATEEVSLRPKTPFIGAEGQFEGHEKKWGQANSKSFAFLEYKPVSVDGVLAPPPQRAPMADVPAGMLQMALHAADNIKAVTGLFDSSLGARGNATSGVQEAQQQRQGDVANFHFIDNRNRSIKHCGRCLVDMIPHYYDAARVVEIMRENGKVEAMPINQPATNEAGQAVDQNGQPIVDPVQQVQAILNDLTIGEYGVTYDAGPSYATAREEAQASMVELGGKWPKVLDVAGDIMVENMDWPGAEKIARRLKATLPPQVTSQDEGEDGKPAGPPPIPPEIEQALHNADQMVDQLHQQLAEAQSGIDKARIDAASREEVARISAASAARVAEINGGAVMSREELISMRAILDHHHKILQQQAAAGHEANAVDQKADIAADAADQAAKHSENQSRLAASQAADQAQTTAEPD
jgi:hypothetical protein